MPHSSHISSYSGPNRTDALEEVLHNAKFRSLKGTLTTALQNLSARLPAAVQQSYRFIGTDFLDTALHNYLLNFPRHAVQSEPTIKISETHHAGEASYSLKFKQGPLTYKITPNRQTLLLNVDNARGKEELSSSFDAGLLRMDNHRSFIPELGQLENVYAKVSDLNRSSLATRKVYDPRVHKMVNVSDPNEPPTLLAPHEKSALLLLGAKIFVMADQLKIEQHDQTAAYMDDFILLAISASNRQQLNSALQGMTDQLKLAATEIITQLATDHFDEYGLCCITKP